MDRILITGGAGFIGSHLASHFLAEGYHVVVLDNLSTGHAHNVPAGVEFVEGDIRDADVVARCASGVRYVLHQAAMVSVPASVSDPHACHAINGDGALNVFHAAAKAGAERLTFAASAAAYGRSEALPKTEGMPVDPISPYAATKLLGEHYCTTFTAQYRLPCVPLRYFNIYGSRQDPSGPYAAVISKFVERMSAGQVPLIFGDGHQTRDFCHVSDVVQANHAALRAPADVAGTPINIGTGRQTSLLDLVETLNDLFGTTLEPEFRDERVGDVRHSLADISRARGRLGYTPQASLHEGLAELLESVQA